MARSGTAAARERHSSRSAEALDLTEVPAAVVCASCGDALCAGCALTDDNTRPSGVVAVIPWERPRLSLRERFWTTAKLATLSCETFFGALTTGELALPLRFAVLAELLAAGGLALTVFLVLAAVSPELARELLTDPTLRQTTLAALGYAVPGLGLAMVAIHAAHGVGLDLGARRQGSTQQRGAGLRFGLYACAWDLVTLPIGLLSILVGDGPRAAARAAVLALTAPRRSAQAYLRAVHRLDDAQATRAARHGALVALVTTLLGLAVAVSAAIWTAVR